MDLCLSSSESHPKLLNKKAELLPGLTILAKNRKCLLSFKQYVPCVWSGRHASSIMSAKVAIQKFSFPFSCAARLPQQDEVTQEGCAQVKLHDLQENRILSEANPVAVIGALVHHESQVQGSPKPPPGGDAAAAQVLVCAEASQSAVLSRHAVFEKLTVESEDQRPAAKRQLSSESAARTITVVKKSAVRKEAEEHRLLKPKAHLGQRVAPCPAVAGKRKRRKDLFTNSEVFHRVDSHAIRAGAEVTTHNSLIKHNNT